MRRWLVVIHYNPAESRCSKKVAPATGDGLLVVGGDRGQINALLVLLFFDVKHNDKHSSCCKQQVMFCNRL